MLFRILFVFFNFSISLFASKFIVVSLAEGQTYFDMVSSGLASHAEYCKKHGYEYYLSRNSLDSSRKVYWGKIPLIQDVMKDTEASWIVWIDADTIIMNQDILLEDFVDENFDFIISEDFNGLNSGIFFLRNCEWSRSFLEKVYSRTDCLDHVWPEQEAIVRVLNESKESQRKTKIVPQRFFNAYCYELLKEKRSIKTEYQNGDFILHFAGSNPHQTGDLLKKLMNKYYPKRKGDRSLFFDLDRFLGVYGYELNPLNSKNNEGYISKAQALSIRQELMQHPNICTILEIGLNGGHSAENFFKSCPNLKHFASFDLQIHNYTLAAVEFFRMKYRSKFEFIRGDSKINIPLYSCEHPDRKFDLIFIDGEHSYQGCRADIINCRKLAHSQTLLIIDDYCVYIKEAIEDLAKDGVIQIDKVYEVTDEAGWRSWVKARYNF